MTFDFLISLGTLVDLKLYFLNNSNYKKYRHVGFNCIPEIRFRNKYLFLTIHFRILYFVTPTAIEKSKPESEFFEINFHIF